LGQKQETDEMWIERVKVGCNPDWQDAYRI